MEADKNKRIVGIAIEDDVRKLTIEGMNRDEQVVMRIKTNNNHRTVICCVLN